MADTWLCLWQPKFLPALFPSMGYLDKSGAVSTGRDSQPSSTRLTHDLVMESTASRTLQASLLPLSVHAEVSAGQHLCLFKSKSNRLRWHLSHTVFAFTALSCGSSWCPWLFIRLLTFQAVSYDSVAPGSGVPGEDCSATDDSGKKEQRTCRSAGRGENKQQVRCFSDKWGNNSVCLSSPSVAACIKSTSAAVKQKTTGLPFFSLQDCATPARNHRYAGATGRGLNSEI